MVQKIPAAMAYGSQTLHRAYSVSSAEGIEMRLNDKFKPTAKVLLPLEYKQEEPRSLAQALEYDFSTENTYLQWLQGVRRAEAEREKQRKQQQLGAEAAEAALQREDPVPKDTSLGHSEFPVQASVPLRPLLPPAAANLGQEILQPVPLTNRSAKPESSTDNSAMDSWADFEGKSFDPFELTELETINDMEELRNVLANSAPPPPATMVASMEVQQSSPPQTDSESEASLCKTNSLDATDDGHQTSIDASFERVSFSSGGIAPQTQTTSAYTPDISSRSIPNQPPGMVQPNRTAATDLTTRLPPVRSEVFGQRSPLPPITPSRENSDVSLLSLDSHGSGLQVSDHGGMAPPPYTPMDTSLSPHGTPSSIPMEPPPNYPAVELEANFPQMNLSRYTPLPAPTSQGGESASIRSIAMEEQDPTYETLSVEEKNFVNTIVGMGFPRGRTARAVKNIGNDDRQVVDLLCAVDHLCGQGYPEAKVEVALSLQDNNQEKAQTFLSLWQRFEELGFKSEDIKRELVVHGNDEEKVLDTLTR
ncbi:ubiquitin-associated protein 1-like [Diadema setosum]|uniref:ubiquitin-associated protein 1-like n=1 Tax=Diadema setosum TaxID=31175 RepID=UPI003B3A22CD